MGFFGKTTKISAAQKREWQQEYDKRVAEGAKVSRKGRMGPQVQDDKGDWYNRDGQACCGCGYHSLADKDDRNMYDPPKIKRGWFS